MPAMVSISGQYLGDLRCRAVHGPSGDTLQTDAPVDNRGQGETFSPTDLCATALATCMTTILAMRADDLGIDVRGLEFSIEKVMSADRPRRIIRLPVTLRIPGALTPAQKASLRRAAESCPVHQSLHSAIAMPLTIVWDDGEETA